MISQVSEQKMRVIRWVLVMGWLLLIASLFYDPFSAQLTAPYNDASPFQDHFIQLASQPELCVRVQGACLLESPYPMGTRIFWGSVVPGAIAIVFVLGHETWRRICPLYFLSQIPRALNFQPRLDIKQNSWLLNNHLYLQFALLFIGLSARILFINSARQVLGGFLLFVIFSAITIVWLYGGRSWCHYICPFGIVQMVFTGPRGFFDSQAHKAPPRSITQSMCRTIDPKAGKEISACINCKSACLDIDAQKSYWEDLSKPGRQLLQYGYLGLVIGYFVYYYLYAGNFKYYFSGVWTHEPDQLAQIFSPGFYLGGQGIPLPKIVAVPLTFALFILITFQIGSYCEKLFFSVLRKRKPQLEKHQARHWLFSLYTFLAFNIFFIYGGRPEILRLPHWLQLVLNGAVVLVSSLWLYRTWKLSYELYDKENLANKLRRQLKKLPFDFSQFLGDRSIDELNADELYVLASVLPNVTQQTHALIYRGVLQEALATELIEANQDNQALQLLRQKLKITDDEHDHILIEILQANPELAKPTKNQQLQLSSAKTRIKAEGLRESDRSRSKSKSSNLSTVLTKIKPKGNIK